MAVYVEFFGTPGYLICSFGESQFGKARLFTLGLGCAYLYNTVVPWDREPIREKPLRSETSLPRYCKHVNTDQ